MKKKNTYKILLFMLTVVICCGFEKLVVDAAGNTTMNRAVNVTKKIQKIVVRPQSLTFYTGGKAKSLRVFNAKGRITYKTSDFKVAKVNSKGKVTPKFPGSAIITVKAAGNKTYKAATVRIKIKVYKRPKNVGDFLKSYKQKNYAKAKVLSKRLPSKAKEACIRNMSDEMKDAYWRKVEFFRKSYYYEEDPWLWNYFLTDINKDGVPELMIRYGSCEADVRSIFYTYKNGKAVQIGIKYVSHAGFFAYPDGNGLIVQTAHQGYETLKKITWSNGKIQMIEIGHRDVGMGAYMDIPYQLKSHSFWNEEERCEMIDYRDLI